MSAIFKITVIMLVTFVIIHLFDNGYIFSGSSGFLLLAGISLAVYVIFRNIFNSSVKQKGQDFANKSNTVINKKSGADNTKKWIYGSLAVIVFIYFLRTSLGIISFRFLLFMDNLLQINANINPVVMWAGLGVFTGLVYGSFVAWKKFNLDFKLNLIPVGILLLIVFILFEVNKPLASQPINNQNSSIGTSSDSVAFAPKKFMVNRLETIYVNGKNRAKFIGMKDKVIKSALYQNDTVILKTR